MKRKIMIIVATGLFALPGVLAAQEHPGGGMHGSGAGQQHMMGSGQHMMGQQNRDMMNHMMGEMQKMMGQGHMTPAHQKQMQGMMNQLDQMKQQMGGSMTPQMEQQHQQRLQGMQQQLNTIKKQGEHQQ